MRWRTMVPNLATPKASAAPSRRAGVSRTTVVIVARHSERRALQMAGSNSRDAEVSTAPKATLTTMSARDCAPRFKRRPPSG